MTATRSVSVDLIARVTGFVAGMKTAQASVSTFTAALSKSAAKQQAFRELGNAAGVMGVVAAAAFVGVVKSAADFDQAMSNVQAATHETAANMDVLRQAALDAGAETVFSATEAAGAIEALSKAGVSTTDILAGGLSGALDLAAAGGIEVEAAAEAAASAMTQFGLAGGDVTHIADLLAAGAGKAQGSVGDLAAALNQVGLVANQTGLSIEETTGGLAAFASAGLTGSDAGTSFKTMLQSLTPRSAEAAKLMEKLNISAYDAGGNFIGLADYAGKLQTALAGMSQEQQAATLKTIFGSDAVRAASVLYEQGAVGIQSWIDKTNDAGYAAETAAIRLDNLMGDLEALKGSLETAFIGTGEGANGPLREMVQLLTQLVNAYNSLPGPVKGGVLAITALTAVIGLSVFAASRAVLAFGNFKTNLSTLGVSAGEASKRMAAMRGGALAAAAGLAMVASRAGDAAPAVGILSGALAGFATTGGPWGAAIGGGVGLLATFADANSAAKANVDALTATLDANTGSITEQSRALVGQQLIDDGLVDNINQFGLSSSEVVDAMLGVGDAAENVRATLAPYSDAVAGVTTASGDLTAEQRNARVAALELLEAIGGGSSDTEAAIRAFEFLAGVQGEGVGTATDLSGAIVGVGASAAAAANKVLTLTESLHKLNDATLDSRGSMRDYEAAVDAARKSLKDNGRTLDTNTEKGRNNEAALDAMAQTAIAHAESMDKDGKSIKAQSQYLRASQDELTEMARKFDTGKLSAREYAEQILDIPTRHETQILIDQAQAERELTAIEAAIADIAHTIMIPFQFFQVGASPPSSPSSHPTQPGTPLTGGGGGRGPIGQGISGTPGRQYAHTSNAQAPAGGASMRITGRVELDLGEGLLLRGVIRGIADDAVDDKAAFAGTAGRMR